jgi:hypothetical protein
MRSIFAALVIVGCAQPVEPPDGALVVANPRVDRRSSRRHGERRPLLKELLARSGV